LWPFWVNVIQRTGQVQAVGQRGGNRKGKRDRERPFTKEKSCNPSVQKYRVGGELGGCEKMIRGRIIKPKGRG